MVWNLTYQDALKKLEARIEKGKPTPFYDERPVLYKDLDKIWLAFWRLNKSRNFDSMGNLSTISITDMVQYKNAFLSYYDLDDFVDLIQSLDNTFINFKNTKETK